MAIQLKQQTVAVVGHDWFEITAPEVSVGICKVEGTVDKLVEIKTIECGGGLSSAKYKIESGVWNSIAFESQDIFAQLLDLSKSKLQKQILIPLTLYIYDTDGHSHPKLLPSKHRSIQVKVEKFAGDPNLKPDNTRVAHYFSMELNIICVALSRSS